MERVYTVILGGGRGQRLYPLTRHRAKPAVPLAGKYRLIDIPLSNAINSGFRQIAVLTQFNSASLNNHIFNTYRFDHFGASRVEVLAAQQTEEGEEWYQGTADAVRKQIRRMHAAQIDHLLILSGDHLYRMDYRELLERHIDTRADVTVCALPCPVSEVHQFGVMRTDHAGRILAFREKPRAGSDLTDLEPPPERRAAWSMSPDEMLASMGVYIFRFDVLRELLSRPEMLDFGKDILPGILDSHRVFAHFFRGYWRDIGTIGAFFDANIGLTAHESPFRFYDPTAPIYSRSRFLPGTKFLDARVSRSIVTEGCLIHGAEVDHSVVGVRSRVQQGAVVRSSILLGADYYEGDDVRAENTARGVDPVGIGPGTLIERAIIDKNARIGANCVIRGEIGRPDQDGDGWYVRDGIVIVPKDGVVAAGTVI